jgi:hypothetical protein
MRTVSLFRLREGKVVYWQGFTSEEQARAVAGEHQGLESTG